MRTCGSTGGAAQPQGLLAKLLRQSQRAALDNPHTSSLRSRVAENEDCRAVALAKADLVTLRKISAASYAAAGHS